MIIERLISYEERIGEDMERIVMEGTPLTLEERLERQANEIRTKEQQIEAQQQEINRLQQWVNDLQAGMYVNCVYCGHRYGPEKDTPVAMSDVLKEHVEHCPKHPMSKLKQEIEELKDQNDGLYDTVNMLAPYIIGKKEAEVVEDLKELLTLKQQNAVLTADKDEQAGRIMRYDTALRQAKEALKYCAISACKPAQGVVESQIRAIDALLGGKEDGSSKDE